MGAHRDNFDDNRGVRRFGGRFFLNGAGAFATATVVGNDYTPLRTGVGILTIKINVVASGVLYWDWDISKSAVAALFPQKLGYAQGTDGMWTLTLRQTTMDGTTPAEWQAANALAFVDFEAVLLIGDRTF